MGLVREVLGRRDDRDVAGSELEGQLALTAPVEPEHATSGAVQAVGTPLALEAPRQFEELDADLAPEDAAQEGGSALQELPPQRAEPAATEMQELRARMLLVKKMIGGPAQDGSDDERVSPRASDERLQRDLLAKVAQRDSEIHNLRRNLEKLEQTEAVFATAVSATGGAAVVGAAGGTAGAAVGGAIGVALGVVPALLTLGLSVPIGGFIGAGCGFLMGSAAGAVAGAVGGGTVGYGVFKNRADICKVMDGAEGGNLLTPRWRIWGRSLQRQ